MVHALGSATVKGRRLGRCGILPLAHRQHGHILMTMKPLHTMAAGEFKAKCLEVLDRVASQGDSYVVTKRGRPVAKVVPISPAHRASLRGSVRYHSDIVASLGDDWPVDE
jgi:prevent-host-death family protein